MDIYKNLFLEEARNWAYDLISREIKEYLIHHYFVDKYLIKWGTRSKNSLIKYLEDISGRKKDLKRI
jgi:hypothetical protein